MFLKIKNRIDKELKDYIRDMDKSYGLHNLSPLLYSNIKEFICRNGKRVRPILFCIGYLGFSKKAAPGLFRSAVSLELLHDFMLIHDDIIDKSQTRRGKPSMHARLNNYLKNKRNIKFNGQDLSIVIGDVLYALALDAFLSVKEDPRRKEAALRKLISAALYTGSGEFIELLLGAKPIERVTKNDIYRIYDYKTANYTFASPLTMGAILAGAKKREINKLFDYGMNLGRAFQIKDDIIGSFSEETEIGKSNLTDLAEAKRTILLWYAYNHCKNNFKAKIKKAFSDNKVSIGDLKKIRKIISCSGSLSYAKEEINNLLRKSEQIIRSSGINRKYQRVLMDFSWEILAV